MSFKKITTKDSISDYLSNLSNFTNISENLLNAKSKQTFVAWFSKMDGIDRRSLILFLEKNKNKIPKEFLKFAEKKHQRKYLNED